MGITEPESVPACSQCGFELWNPIARLRVSTLGLYDDARFPGRCILVFDSHVEDVLELSPDEAGAYLADTRIAALAIQSAVHPVRMNYAILGNAVPHLHIHLIPRLRGDPVLTQSPWRHPLGAVPLSAAEKGRLIRQLRGTLNELRSGPAVGRSAGRGSSRLRRSS